MPAIGCWVDKLEDDLPLLAPPDVHIFTTWTPHSWSRVNFDDITFPADTAINIRTVQGYMAVAMILWYDTELRTKYDHVWEALKYAWLAKTFFGIWVSRRPLMLSR